MEQAVRFDCQGETLVGIVHAPAAGLAKARSAVVVVAGGPQYRAGSHRQFVQTTRALAAAGHAALVFDVRGMGDSTGAQRSFENIGDDIGAAIDALGRAAPTARHLVLLGLCDGAAAALLYLQSTRDARVTGLCLLNPWVRSEATLARTHLKHYYLQRLGQADFWRKLLRGGVQAGRLSELARSVRSSLRLGQAESGPASRLPFQQAMALAWQQFRGPLMLVVSGADLTAKEFLEHAQAFPDWRGLLALPTVTRVNIEGADHTLSDSRSQAAFESALTAWVSRSFAAA